MTAPKKDIDAKLTSLIKQYGSITAYKGSKILKMKYDTVKSHLDLMVKNGTLYTREVGKSTHYALAPSGVVSGVKPDRSKERKKTEGDGRVSVIVPITRASTVTEIIREKGFVCHPNTKGKTVSADFIRCHHNGEYQVRIVEKGKMAEGTHYIPIEHTDQTISVKWTYNDLTLNMACLCKIKIPSDERVFALRTVSTKDGKINTMSIWVHPRYIYNVGVVDTAYAEFLQQVMDLLTILETDGWKFDKTDVAIVGDHHYAFNDATLGGLVQSYERTEGAPVEFDHSHGVDEMEVIGDKGELIECIANLPQIFRNMTATIMEIGKQVQTLAKIQVDTLTTVYPEKPFDNGGRMYG